MLAPVLALILAKGPGAAARAQPLEDIVYTSDGNLESVSPDGKKHRRCRPLARSQEYSSPAWNATKTWLTFEAGPHDEKSRLYVVSSRCADVKPLADSEGFIRPTWSPDGARIFAVSYGLKDAVGAWQPTGERLPDVPVERDGPHHPFQTIEVSPSGRRAALLNERFENITIAAFDGERMKVTTTLPRGFSYVSGARWLTDNQLLFVGKKSEETAQLWRLNVDSGKPSVVAMPSLEVRDWVAVSPDRKQAVVCAGPTKEEAPAWSLWRYSFKTRELARITKGQEDVEPTWATATEPAKPTGRGTEAGLPSARVRAYRRATASWP
jgi:dipeptidyl aminopeptidase/acylaminoacyl peptidase